MPFVADEVVTAAKLNAATFQSWSDWTPTYANLTVGSGTVVARYTGGGAAGGGKLVVCYFEFTFGSGSAVGSNPTISLPVAAASGYTAFRNWIGIAQMHDNNTDVEHVGFIRLASTTTVNPRVGNAAGTTLVSAAVSATSPMTWATSDKLFFTATYEAA